jgi:hypothetical protein
MLLSIEPSSNSKQQKRRGRPCATERYNNELMQEKFTRIINSNAHDLNDEFTKLSVLPFVVNRQRRVRANVREKNRMQTLNQALHVLKKHLPIDLLTPSESNISEPGYLDNPNPNQSFSSKSKRKLLEHKLTKIDTLKLATKYISILTEMLSHQDLNNNEPMQLRVYNPLSSTCSSSLTSSSDSSSPLLDKVNIFNFHWDFKNL